MHLSNRNKIIAMTFYSLITFFITPILTRDFFEDYQDPCIIGFLIGFVISICLWVKYGRYL